ncbi:hypothetical protein MPLSOD_330089 [Mesorhizobium sp. SOD10]|nr:hypothetical protein MPLSOD_330089 [Mesorhizobium sp. SOD10]
MQGFVLNLCCRLDNTDAQADNHSGNEWRQNPNHENDQGLAYLGYNAGLIHLNLPVLHNSTQARALAGTNHQ